MEAEAALSLINKKHLTVAILQQPKSMETVQLYFRGGRRRLSYAFSTTKLCQSSMKSMKYDTHSLASRHIQDMKK